MTIVDVLIPGQFAVVVCAHGTTWPEGADFPIACKPCVDKTIAYSDERTSVELS